MGKSYFKNYIVQIISQ